MQQTLTDANCGTTTFKIFASRRDRASSGGAYNVT